MVELETIADTMLRHDDPVLKTGDIADELDCTSRHVLDQLQLLERAGEVNRKQIGARAVAWWHVDRVCPPKIPPEEHPAQRSLDDETGRQVEPAEPVNDSNHEPATESDASLDLANGGTDELDEQVGTLDLPGSGETLEARREAVRQCYHYLRECGSAQKSDFVSDVFPGHDGGYESSGGWWNAVGKSGLQTLAKERDDVQAPQGEGTHTWHFVE